MKLLINICYLNKYLDLIKERERERWYFLLRLNGNDYDSVTKKKI